MPGTDGLHRAAVDGLELCLGVVDGAWLAIRDCCTHEECALSDGWLVDGAVECGCHGARFDLRSGSVLEGPADEPVQTYAVRGAPPSLEVFVAPRGA